ncbi:MAG: transcriptional regulator [Acidobacteria bacterium]|nr:transcriptional regulator [Acidobacteriota bacterium]
MTGLEDLEKALVSIEDAVTMHRFFEEIFTPAERQTLGLRWELMRLLRQQVSQRDIADRLNISLCKITRGSRILKDSNSVTNRLMDALYG